MDLTLVNEHIRTASRWSNEAKPLLHIEPFYCTRTIHASSIAPVDIVGKNYYMAFIEGMRDHQLRLN